MEETISHGVLLKRFHSESSFATLLLGASWANQLELTQKESTLWDYSYPKNDGYVVFSIQEYEGNEIQGK